MVFRTLWRRKHEKRDQLGGCGMNPGGGDGGLGQDETDVLVKVIRFCIYFEGRAPGVSVGRKK